MVGHGHALPLEVVGTVIEMADVAWNALEHHRDRKLAAVSEEVEGDEVFQLRAENLRLKGILSDNLALLRSLSHNAALSKDCPPDLHARLLAAVDTSSFLSKLELLYQESTVMPNGIIPVTDATGAGLNLVDLSDSADNGEPNLWVWVTKDMVLDNLEEVSGIDNENYVIINEENVVDGIADFIAKCILDNPKSKVLTPKELQKTVTKALGGIKDRSKLRHVWEAGKVIYTLSTWGITLVGLYRGRAILKAAAVGVHTSSKIVMKAL